MENGGSLNPRMFVEAENVREALLAFMARVSSLITIQEHEYDAHTEGLTLFIIPYNGGQEGEVYEATYTAKAFPEG